MGKVIVTIRIVPEDQEKLNEIKEKIKNELKPEKIYEEDFVFGLKAIKIDKIIEDKENELNKLEESISKISSNYEIEKITRIFIE